MKKREAIRILMESPLYWRWTPADRNILIKGYCEDYNKVSRKYEK